MKTKFIIIYCFFAVSILKAQRINVALPAVANKDYIFILNKGIKPDTIQRGRISFTGNAIVNISDKYRDYVGVGVFVVKGGEGINMIVNRENFDVLQSSNGQYQFKGSLENQYLYSVLGGGQLPSINSNMYVYHFLDIYRFMVRLNAVQQRQNTNLSEKANVRTYAINSLDFDRLYTSGLWYNVIDGLVKIYGGQSSFGQDMIHILKRIKRNDVFEHFASNLVTITEQFGWDDAFDEIVSYVQASGRIKTPTGQIYRAFSLAKIQKGSTAPNIQGLSTSLIGKNKVLLVFYQPDCGNCKVQIAQLVQNYSIIQKHKVRVVSISGGYKKEEFDKDYNHFPWRDKLCDFKGFAGANFVNYGIIGTPTFFLLNENQKLIKRYANIGDVISKIKQN